MKKLENRSLLVIVSLIGCLAFLTLTLDSAAASDTNIRPKVTQIEPPKKVLFIGNSHTYYNNSKVATAFVRFAREADRANAKSYRVSGMTIPGARLSDHVYGIQAIPDPLNKKTNLSIKWDVVVLQGQTREVMRETDKFKATARDFNEIIRNSGAKTAFFMIWVPKPMLEMAIPRLYNTYVQLGNELNTLVVPVGLAFYQALKEKPEVELFMEDQRHPSEMGSYLAACVFYSAFYNRSLVGNPFTDGLDQADAEFLQNIAWNTVKEFYGR